MVSEFPFVTSPWLPPLPLSCLYLESIMSEHHAKVKPEKKVKVQILQRGGVIRSWMKWYIQKKGTELIILIS